MLPGERTRSENNVPSVEVYELMMTRWLYVLEMEAQKADLDLGDKNDAMALQRLLSPDQRTQLKAGQNSASFAFFHIFKQWSQVGSCRAVSTCFYCFRCIEKGVSFSCRKTL